MKVWPQLFDNHQDGHALFSVCRYTSVSWPQRLAHVSNGVPTLLQNSTNSIITRMNVDGEMFSEVWKLQDKCRDEFVVGQFKCLVPSKG